MKSSLESSSTLSMLRPISRIATPLAQHCGAIFTQRATGLKEPATAIWKSRVDPNRCANGACIFKHKVGHTGKTFGLDSNQDYVAKKAGFQTFSQAPAVANESVTSRRDNNAGQVRLYKGLYCPPARTLLARQYCQQLFNGSTLPQ